MLFLLFKYFTILVCLEKKKKNQCDILIIEFNAVLGIQLILTFSKDQLHTKNKKPYVQRVFLKISVLTRSD